MVLGKAADAFALMADASLPARLFGNWVHLWVRVMGILAPRRELTETGRSPGTSNGRGQ